VTQSSPDIRSGTALCRRRPGHHFDAAMEPCQASAVCAQSLAPPCAGDGRVTTLMQRWNRATRRRPVHNCWPQSVNRNVQHGFFYKRTLCQVCAGCITTATTVRGTPHRAHSLPDPGRFVPHDRSSVSAAACCFVLSRASALARCRCSFTCCCRTRSLCGLSSCSRCAPSHSRHRPWRIGIHPQRWNRATRRRSVHNPWPQERLPNPLPAQQLNPSGDTVVSGHQVGHRPVPETAGSPH
jgi:hypothetical protein